LFEETLRGLVGAVVGVEGASGLGAGIVGDRVVGA